MELITPGSELELRIFFKKHRACSRYCYCPPELMAALWLMTPGSKRCHRISCIKLRASSLHWPFSQELIVELKLITPGSKLKRRFCFKKRSACLHSFPHELMAAV